MLKTYKRIVKCIGLEDPKEYACYTFIFNSAMQAKMWCNEIYSDFSYSMGERNYIKLGLVDPPVRDKMTVTIDVPLQYDRIPAWNATKILMAVMYNQTAEKGKHINFGDVTPWFWPTFDVEEANDKGDIMREEE